MAWFAAIIVNRFAGVLFISPHLSAPSPALFFTAVSAWFLVFAALVAAFVFLAAGRPGVGMGFSCNVLG
jgi:hypothetical protein